MKKILLFSLIAVMLLSVACAQQQTSEPPVDQPTAPIETSAPTPGTSNEPDSSPSVIKPAEVKVGLVLGGTLGDQSVNDLANRAIEEAKQEHGVQTKVIECTDSSMYADAMQKLCDEGYNLIVLNTFNEAEALKLIAPSYPDVNFMILDTVVEGANVASFTYSTQECSFLAGVIAAKTSKSGKIGFIGGMEIPTIKRFEVGFTEGVAYANPEATVTAKYVGNDNTAWRNPAQAKSLTLDLVANGVDVCFHAAGGSGLGMIEACTESKIYAIGVNIDQSYIAPEAVLTSALTNGDVAIKMFIQSYIAGNVLTGETILNLENGGVGLSESKFISDTDMALIGDITQKIVSGEISVTDTLKQN